MMSIKDIDLVRKFSKAKRSARSVLANLASRANKEGLSWPSYNRIAKDTGLSRRTVMRAVIRLQVLDELIVKTKSESHRTQRGIQATNRYVINRTKLESYGGTPQPGTTSGETSGSDKTGTGVVTTRPSVGDKVTPESKTNPTRKGKIFELRIIDIHDEDGSRILKDPANNAIDLAFSLTKEDPTPLAVNTQRKMLRELGEQNYREVLEKYWNDRREDVRIFNPGAYLVKLQREWFESLKARQT